MAETMNERINKAQVALLKATLAEIEEMFVSSESDNRLQILSKLEKTISSRRIKIKGELARKIRESANLTLRGLADKLGVSSPQTVSNWERNKNLPTERTLQNYLAWLKVNGYKDE